jgi:hypothetical protein
MKSSLTWRREPRGWPFTSASTAALTAGWRRLPGDSQVGDQSIGTSSSAASSHFAPVGAPVPGWKWCCGRPVIRPPTRHFPLVLQLGPGALKSSAQELRTVEDPTPVSRRWIHYRPFRRRPMTGPQTGGQPRPPATVPIASRSTIWRLVTRSFPASLIVMILRQVVVDRAARARCLLSRAARLANVPPRAGRRGCLDQQPPSGLIGATQTFPDDGEPGRRPSPFSPARPRVSGATMTAARSGPNAQNEPNGTRLQVIT